MTYNTVFFYAHMFGRRIRSAGMASVVLLLAACASQSTVVYPKESFAVNSPYQKKVEVGAAVACEAARRALLGDGYVIDSANSDSVKGRKAYHSEGQRSTFIEMSVVCVPDASGSTLYANGLLSTYDVKKSAASASVGVSAIGSLSLPIGQSADSMVKISDETFTDRGFYHRFFTAVDAVLTEMKPETPPAARPSRAAPQTVPLNSASPPTAPSPATPSSTPSSGQVAPPSAAPAATKQGDQSPAEKPSPSEQPTPQSPQQPTPPSPAP